jgi:copper homeostasis protein
MNKRVILEVCANSVASALAAQQGGAYRVELCENLHEGGTTPSYGDIMVARKNLDIKLYVLIRPRGGDFLYTDLEYEIMRADVKHCLDAGCDGIVIGMLNADGSVDKYRCAELVRLAKNAGAGVTFHRAFDLCNDQFKAMEDIIDVGFERILTSGGKTTAIEGSNRIAELVSKAGCRITIMPGSGVNEHNVADLVRYTGVTEVHSSARKRVQSQMIFRKDHIIMSNSHGDEYSHEVTDAARVKAILESANRSI